MNVEPRSEVETALEALVRDLEPISSIAKDVESSKLMKLR